jgi:hypothetical protein
MVKLVSEMVKNSIEIPVSHLALAPKLEIIPVQMLAITLVLMWILR